MNTSTISSCSRLIFPVVALAVFLVSTLLPAAAAEQPAGKVAAVAGKVTAAGADGSIRTIGKDDPIFAGDIVSTGPNSRVRIVFSDDGVVFLRPSTRFVIKAYSHNNAQKEDESKFSLVKGGFRSVTGAIGHANTKNYSVDTPVATIGIRGTDHEGRYCAGDCIDLADVGVAPPPDGLYTGTNSGQTVVGDQHFEAGQYGFTNLEGKTFSLPEPPQILIKDPLFSGALTDKGTEKTPEKDAVQEEGEKKTTEQDSMQKEQPKEEEKPNEQSKGKTGNDAGSKSPTTEVIDDGAASGNDKGFEIPAKAPTTQTIDCR